MHNRIYKVIFQHYHAMFFSLYLSDFPPSKIGISICSLIYGVATTHAHQYSYLLFKGLFFSTHFTLRRISFLFFWMNFCYPVRHIKMPSPLLRFTHSLTHIWPFLILWSHSNFHVPLHHIKLSYNCLHACHISRQQASWNKDLLIFVFIAPSWHMA